MTIGIFTTFGGLINRNFVPTPPHYDTQPNNAIFHLKLIFLSLPVLLEPKLEN